MRKIFIITLIGLLLSSIAIPAFATNRIVQKISITDPINKERILPVGSDVANLADAVDTSGSDGTYVEGNVIVYGIVVSGDGTAAGDVITIHDSLVDGLGAAALLASKKVGITLGTAEETIYMPFPNGIYFANDVGVDTTDSANDVTIIYGDVS